MRWKGRKQSSHVEDRRGTTVRGGAGAIGGGAIGSILFMLFRRGGLKTKLMLIVAVIAGCMVFKINPMSLLTSTSGGGDRQAVQNSDYVPSAAEKEMLAYLATMKKDNELVWEKIFAAQGWPKYRPSNLIVYRGTTNTPGGVADSRTGPFYMPADESIYLDPSFFQELSQKFGATGDFAQAYVMAHEVAHHVQKLLGLTDRLNGKSGQERNKLSVRLELQADFLAGVFAHHAQERFKFLEQGDLEEAIRCAKAIGDDTIQKKSQGRVQPHLFTHGTSEQRQRWFMRGFKSGNLSEGDTFSIPYEDL